MVYSIQHSYPFGNIEAVVQTPNKRYLVKIRAADYGEGMNSINPADKAVIETFISSFRFN